MIVGVYRKIWACKAAKGHVGAAGKLERITNGPITGNKFALLAALGLLAVCIIVIIGLFYAGGHQSRAFRAKLEAYKSMEPAPLSDFIGKGHEDAYVIFIGAYMPIHELRCRSFSEEFYKNMGLDLHVDEGAYILAIYDEKGLIKKVEGFYLQSYPQADNCAKLKDIWVVPQAEGARQKFIITDKLN